MLCICVNFTATDKISADTQCCVVAHRYQSFLMVIVRIIDRMSATNHMERLISETTYYQYHYKLECGPMPNVMADLPNIGGALCSTP